MRMEQLKYFSEVAKYHSIALAAEKLFVTQPTISIAIKNMEKELECTLLERSKNGVYLTEIGRQVLKKCEIILKEENEIHTLIAENKLKHLNKLQGQLAVVTIPLLGYAFLYDTVFDFLNENDAVHIMFEETNAQYILEHILKKEADIAFSFLTNKEIVSLMENEELCAKKMYSEKTYVVAHKCFELSGNTSIRSEQLKDLPVVSFTDLPVTHYSNLLNKPKEDSKIILKAYSMELLKRFIYEGKAVSIITSSVASKLENEKAIDIIPISDLDSGHVYCLYRRDNPNLELRTAFEIEAFRHC